jgi:hypothetical protein
MESINCFDCGIGAHMRKAAHPSGGMDSSNPRRWGVSGSTTMVMVFVMLFVLFVRFLTCDSSVELVRHTF